MDSPLNYSSHDALGPVHGLHFPESPESEQQSAILCDPRNISVKNSILTVTVQFSWSRRCSETGSERQSQTNRKRWCHSDIIVLQIIKCKYFTTELHVQNNKIEWLKRRRFHSRHWDRRTSTETPPAPQEAPGPSWELQTKTEQEEHLQHEWKEQRGWISFF